MARVKPAQGRGDKPPPFVKPALPGKSEVITGVVVGKGCKVYCGGHPAPYTAGQTALLPHAHAAAVIAAGHAAAPKPPEPAPKPE